MSSGEPTVRMLFSAFIALLFTVVPLPFWLDVARPSFLILAVLHWSIFAPRAGGIGLGWFSGLFLDVFQGSLLGEHALALAAVTYVFCREHQKIRSKPGFQQSLIVLAGLAAYEVLLFLIDGSSGHPVTSPLRWIPILSGAIAWPLATALLGYRERRA